MNNFKSRNWSFTLSLIAVFLLIGLTKFLAYDVYHIPTNSMSPAIEAGDRVIASKWKTGTILPKWLNPNGDLRSPQLSNINKGDIILFRHPAKDEPIWDRVILAKRVNGIAGEYLSLPDEGINNLYIPAAGDSTEYDHYFVMGDFKENSHDSRHWGLVPSNLIIGKVERVLYSTHDPIKHWENKKFNWGRFLKGIE